ncbi:MAG: hypothetical protein QNJ70_29675 [Xenococcaceae cyanobacterium MO_207.B15]|nr:hypothetical protein [Xenococcaceae cyanobacterium MO_207.B15]
MNNKLTTIDPNQGNIPDTAIIQKVVSENDRLPNGEHEKAVKAFYFSDSIASGIGKDFAFVEKIPQLISDIIDNKSWECLYVSRGVVTPYYCRYTKGTDSENFRAFIAAKRPNGLETTIETIDRLLEAEPEVQWKFRTVVYESRQGDRTDLENTTSYGDRKKLDSELSQTQKSVIRAANRAAEAIPEIRELLDRSLIAIDVAAKLGRDIKDPDNLTAEEREYVDKRDLVGLRIKSYINTNTIPDDEDKEPVYSRKLNEFVKDLLGIKNRSKTVRMDNPKKAAEKLLKFYQGDKLKELLEYLGQGLTINNNPQGVKGNPSEKQTSTPTEKKTTTANVNDTSHSNSYQNQKKATSVKKIYRVENNQSAEFLSSSNGKIINHQAKLSFPSRTSHPGEPSSPGVSSTSENTLSQKALQKSDFAEETAVTLSSLTLEELAERLRIKPRTISSTRQRNPEKFPEWTQKKDPDGIAWERSNERQGRAYVFFPVQEAKDEGF